jgi:hypothetical protein
MDAIILNDGRELWNIYWDFKIESYVDEYCLSTKDNRVEEGAPIVASQCTYASSGKWIVFKNHDSPYYAISNNKDNSLVIA